MNNLQKENLKKEQKDSVSKPKKNSKKKKKKPGQFGVVKEDKEEGISLVEQLETLNAAEALSVLSKPQVFQVPDIALQQDIVSSLEKILGDSDKSLLFIGAIQLTELEETDTLNDLIKSTQLVNLKSEYEASKAGENGDNAHALASNLNLYNEIDETLKAKIIKNTLTTMHEAGQLEYFKKSELINDEWKVLIEVHYYRKRGTGNGNKLHKDTLGQTLFVNLNYLNDQEIAGPEFVINPYSDEENQARIKSRLPNKFVKDLKLVGDSSPNGSIIETTDIMANGVVAFVDEAIHHTTPIVEHRKVTSEQIGSVYTDIKKQCKKYNEAINSKLSYFKNTDLTSYFSKLDDKYKNDATGWLQIMTAPGSSQYNRHGLKQLLPHMPDEEIDRLIEIGGYKNYGEASIPRFQGKDTVLKPVRMEAVSPMQRRMSMRLTNNSAPPDPTQGEARKFFRTWVRAVRK
ncbi:hypothetical protein [Spirosoma lituiforme]